MTTVAGVAGAYGTTDGIGSAARFNYPWGVAVGPDGFLYVVDSYNHTIRKVSPGGEVSTFAGAPGVSGSTDGPATEARFYAPRGVTVDTTGNLFVADSYNDTIRKISPQGTVSTVAGSPGAAASVDGNGASARFGFPNDLAVDDSGTLWVADNGALRTVSPNGDVRTVVAVRQIDDDFAAGAVAVDHHGFVYVATYDTIRRIAPNGEVTTLAGMPGEIGNADGAGSQARFYGPHGLTVSPTGDIFVADSYNDTIRKVSQTGTVTTLAGVAIADGSIDGDGASARFSEPFGITLDPSGALYLTDDRTTVRKIV